MMRSYWIGLDMLGDMGTGEAPSVPVPGISAATAARSLAQAASGGADRPVPKKPKTAARAAPTTADSTAAESETPTATPTPTGPSGLFDRPAWQIGLIGGGAAAVLTGGALLLGRVFRGKK